MKIFGFIKVIWSNEFTRKMTKELVIVLVMKLAKSKWTNMTIEDAETIAEIVRK